jgi:phage tail P2-like protein
MSYTGGSKVIEITDIRLIDLVPPNLRDDPTIRAAAEALDTEIRKVSELIPLVTIQSNLNTLPERWVDELAWQNHVDFYDQSLPIEQKRQLVRNALAWHRRKGTASAVRELIQDVFGDGEIREWFEYGGQPGMFKVITSNAAVTAEDAEKFLTALDSVRRISAHLDAIEITMTNTLQMYVGMPLHIGEFMTV